MAQAVRRAARRRSREGGYVLVVALVTLAVLSLLGAAAVRLGNAAITTARSATESEQALYAANAGMELVLAKLRAVESVLPGDRFTGEVALGTDGRTARYEVAIAEGPEEGLIAVTSVGEVGRSHRTITGVIALPRVEVVPGGPEIYRQALLVSGELTVPNNALVCGDLTAAGRIRLENNVRVLGTAGGECPTVYGTGRVISLTAVEMGRNVTVEGGYCDPEHNGADTPCPEWPPEVAGTVTPADVEALREQATWAPPVDRLMLDGVWSFAEPAVVFVEGAIEVPKNASLQVSGTVTFVAAGEVRIGNNAVVGCGEPHCPVAFLSGDRVEVGNRAEVHASLYAQGALRLGNGLDLYGNMEAPAIEMAQGNDLRLFPHPQPPVVPPPGLPGGGEAETVVILPDGYLRWDE